MKRIIPFIFFAGLAGFLGAQNQNALGYVQEGIASWYGAEFEGRPTASGEAFNAALFTAAHPTLPFGTMLKITNKQNNRSVIVRVNDRGPFVSARIIDISRAAAQQLDMIKTGTAPVIVESLAADPANEGQIYNSETIPPVEKPQPSASPYPAYPPSPAAQNQSGAAILRGVTPGDNSAKLYRIQVGAYLQPRNAIETFEKLKNAGLNPAYEKYNDFYRVVLSGVKNHEVQSIAEKLGKAGFREAIIREEN